MSANTEQQRTSRANWRIVDPGNGGTIDGSRTGTVAIVTGASAQTRTQAAPEYVGLRRTFCMETDGGGDCTVTVTGGYNEAGSTTFVLANTGEYVILESVYTATNTLGWRMVFGDTATSLVTAGEVSIADAGTYTAETSVEGAIQEIYDTLAYWNTVNVPLGAITLEDGTVLAKQAASAAGYAQLSNKNVVIQLPAATAAFAFAFTAYLPDDFDSSKELKVAVGVSKNGNTDTDLTLDAEIYFLDFTNGWSADGYAGNAVAMTASLSSMEYSVANPGAVTDVPVAVAVVLTTSNTNDTDVAYIHSVRVRYHRKHQ